MPGPPLPPKKEVFVALLQGPSVFVHLDPRKEHVNVPKWFKKQPQLVLQLGLNMAVNIPDLEATDAGVSCTLSFNRSPFWCSVPWSAIYALVGEDGRGMIWQEDVPTELASQTTRPNLKAVPAKRTKKKKDAPADPAAASEAKAGESRPRAFKLAAVPSPSAEVPDDALAKDAAAEPDAAAESATASAGASAAASEAEASEAEASEAEASEAEASEAEASETEASETKASETEASEAEEGGTEAATAEASETDAAGASDTTSGGEDEAKGKRELPPYLRVIK